MSLSCTRIEDKDEPRREERGEARRAVRAALLAARERRVEVDVIRKVVVALSSASSAPARSAERAFHASSRMKGTRPSVASGRKRSRPASASTSVARGCAALCDRTFGKLGEAEEPRAHARWRGRRSADGQQEQRVGVKGSLGSLVQDEKFARI